MLNPSILQLIDLALIEDLGAGDATTEAIFSARDRSTGTLLVKSPTVLCGARVFDAVMRRVDPEIEVRWGCQDGEEVEPGTVVARFSGPTARLLQGERTALNFLQRMSGVATATRRYAKALEGTGASVTDTRKTLPGWRLLDKEAVRVGGGRNHRVNLGGGVMIKDNHIAAAGSIARAVERVRAYAPHTLRVEVEVVSLEQLPEAVGAGADILLLDNMTTAQMREGVALARSLAGARPILLEASGGITFERLAEIAATGVDLISVGALTHSVKAADISLDLDPA